MAEVEETKYVTTSSQPTAPDGGYGWVVLVASFVSFFIADGWSYSFGVLFPVIVDYFEESHGTTSMVGTLLYAIPMIVSPLACALVSAYGIQFVAIVGGLVTSLSLSLAVFATSIGSLCVIVGLFTGIGLAMVYVSAFFAVTIYFEKRRGLATGIAVAGSGVGALMFPPLIERLMEQYSWWGTMLIAGGLCLNLAVVGALFRPLVKVNEQHSDPVAQSHATCGKLLASELLNMFSSMFDCATLSSVPFLLFCCANFVLYLWISVPYVYIVDYAMVRVGLPYWDSSLLLSVSGIGRIVGQLLFGILGDMRRVSPAVLFGCGSALTGLFTALVPAMAVSYPTLGVYAAAFGMSAAVTYVLPMICLVEILGLDRAVNAFGFLQLVQGVATLVGTPIAGKFLVMLKLLLAVLQLMFDVINFRSNSRFTLLGSGTVLH